MVEWLIFSGFKLFEYFDLSGKLHILICFNRFQKLFLINIFQFLLVKLFFRKFNTNSFHFFLVDFYFLRIFHIGLLRLIKHSLCNL
jgi:hypothetical protein